MIYSVSDSWEAKLENSDVTQVAVKLESVDARAITFEINLNSFQKFSQYLIEC